MDDIVITTEMIKRQVKVVKNWSASSPDELHGSWLKHSTSLHQCIPVQFNPLLQNSATEHWMTTDHTFLIMKDYQKGNEPTACSRQCSSYSQ